jgi:hypothetical protein
MQLQTIILLLVLGVAQAAPMLLTPRHAEPQLPAGDKAQLPAGDKAQLSPEDKKKVENDLESASNCITERTEAAREGRPVSPMLAVPSRGGAAYIC